MVAETGDVSARGFLDKDHPAGRSLRNLIGTWKVDIWDIGQKVRAGSIETVLSAIMLLLLGSRIPRRDLA